MLIGVCEGCLIITEITEITERVGVFSKAFRRFLSSIKMFLLKPRNACRGSRDAACCVTITIIYLRTETRTYRLGVFQDGTRNLSFKFYSTK